MRRVLLSLTLLWLAGAGLRLTVLAVPPMLPLIHDDLHLSETQVGILTGLPSLLFALAAVPGSMLIARDTPDRCARSVSDQPRASRSILMRAPRRVSRSSTIVDILTLYHTSVPIPKFTRVCRTLRCELRNRRTLANL